MAANDDIELMQYADGELPPEAQARIDHLRDGDSASVSAKLDGLSEINELVRGHLELAGDAVPDRTFDNMWRTISREIGKTVPAAAAASAVERAPSQQPERARGLWGAISGWFDRYRGHIITGAVSAGAVAALALIMRPAAPGSEPTARATSAPIEVQPAALRAAPVIEALDTPGGNATVINIEDEDGHAAVIWVTPADTVEGI